MMMMMRSEGWLVKMHPEHDDVQRLEMMFTTAYDDFEKVRGYYDISAARWRALVASFSQLG